MFIYTITDIIASIILAIIIGVWTYINLKKGRKDE